MPPRPGLLPNEIRYPPPNTGGLPHVHAHTRTMCVCLQADGRGAQSAVCCPDVGSCGCVLWGRVQLAESAWLRVRCCPLLSDSPEDFVGEAAAAQRRIGGARA